MWTDLEWIEDCEEVGQHDVIVTDVQNGKDPGASKEGQENGRGPEAGAEQDGGNHNEQTISVASIMRIWSIRHVLGWESDNYLHKVSKLNNATKLFHDFLKCGEELHY